jgi:hypothetical protein
VVNHSQLGPAAIAPIEAALPRLATLEDVIHWGLCHRSERMIVGVVVQDEYTHDVVMQWTDGHFLVFDTN